MYLYLVPEELFWFEDKGWFLETEVRENLDPLLEQKQSYV